MELGKTAAEPCNKCVRNAWYIMAFNFQWQDKNILIGK